MRTDRFQKFLGGKIEDLGVRVTLRRVLVSESSPRGPNLRVCGFAGIGVRAGIGAIGVFAKVSATASASSACTTLIIHPGREICSCSDSDCARCMRPRQSWLGQISRMRAHVNG